MDYRFVDGSAVYLCGNDRIAKPIGGGHTWARMPIDDEYEGVPYGLSG